MNFEFFFAKLRCKIIKLDFWLHTNSKKNTQYIKMTGGGSEIYRIGKFEKE